MKILGLDLSTKPGAAILDTRGDYSGIMCQFYVLEGETDFHRFASAGRLVRELLNTYKPDFVVIETPLQGGKNVRAVVDMNFIAGSVASVLDIMKIGYGLVSIPTWRKAVYGEGFKPAVVQRIKRNGETVTEKEDWGDIAVRKCRSLGIDLPAGKDAHNAAEAALIAISWRHATPQGPRSVEAFRACLSRRNDERKTA